jgi:carboxymethylenebutenolidase
MPDMSFPVAGGTITGGTVPGYLALPAGDGPWPGVVVIHEIFGLSDDTRRKADELAAHGYLALAPDLFEGRPFIRCIRGAFRQLKAGSGPAFTVLEAGRDYLTARQDCSGKTGVIGFCMGGGFALLCAPRDGFAAAAVNYGDVPDDAESVLAGACPVVGSYGGRDKAIPTKQPERLQRALTVLEIPHDIKVYPGSGHRFMSESSGALGVFAKVTGMSYQRHDAADAWERIYAFFGRYLS